MTELFATSSPDESPNLWGDALPQTAGNQTGAPAYRVLARKYRPSTFAQLIGQESMVRTLSNAIAAGRLPQAWMLTGVRGIGKTTTARIIARALNCTGVDGKGGATIMPCGVCDACKAIAEDRHVDVQEMDAASRTSVDDIREIIDGVRYGPVSARYKIYILDEVHMLSKNAFNALLKTLEEPPPHTKFIFATTEIRKVPVTVLSRCQRFDLRRIDSAMLTKHFTEIAALEQVEIEPEAIKLIAQAADGSVRDGLSLLDQAIARGNGTVTNAEVQDMLGLADRGHSMVLCRQLLRGAMADALQSFTMMMQIGTDPLQVLQDMAEMIHLLTRGQIITNIADAPERTEAEKELLTDLSDIKMPALTRAWQIILKGILEVQTAPNPSQAAEMVLIRLAYAAELPSPAELIKQLREITPPAGQVSANVSTKDAGVPPPLRGRLGGGGGNQSTAALYEAQPSAIPTPSPTTAFMPTNFRELAALFEQNREGGLYAQLYQHVHPVRCEAGLLEIRVTGEAAPSLASRLTQCLTQWTGQRWMVSITDKQGAMSLAEYDAIKEKKRQERVHAHPLMQAVMLAFPDAKTLSLKQKIVDVLAVTDDDAVDNELVPLLDDL